jgi:hypothetical protein
MDKQVLLHQNRRKSKGAQMAACDIIKALAPNCPAVGSGD